MSVRFRREEPGEYVALVNGERWLLERRRREATGSGESLSPGWYLWGPCGEPAGIYMGQTLPIALIDAERELPVAVQCEHERLISRLGRHVADYARCERDACSGERFCRAHRDVATDRPWH